MTRLRRWLKARLTRFPRLYYLIHFARHPDLFYHLVTDEIRFHPRDPEFFEMALRKEFLRRCFTYLKFNHIQGDYAEFGCNGAMTFRLAHSASRLVGYPACLWGFDSFAGLPEPAGSQDEHPMWVPGTMATSAEEFHEICRAHGIPREDYEVVSGFFEDSLKRGAPGARPAEISLAYIDCDLFSSTVEVLRFLEPRLKHGMILAFDDYYCYSPESSSGERLAAGKFFSGNRDWRLVPYQPFGWHGMSFIVESKLAAPDDLALW